LENAVKRFEKKSNNTKKNTEEKKDELFPAVADEDGSRINLS